MKHLPLETLRNIEEFLWEVQTWGLVEWLSVSLCCCCM